LLVFSHRYQISDQDYSLQLKFDLSFDLSKVVFYDPETQDRIY